MDEFTRRAPPIPVRSFSPEELNRWRELSEDEALETIGYRDEFKAATVRDIEHASGLRRARVLTAAYLALALRAWEKGYSSRAIRYRRRCKKWRTMMYQERRAAGAPTVALNRHGVPMYPV